MKVILRQDIPDLGKAGETLEVKGGYGRNFLIPRNMAIPATKANLKAIGEIDKQNLVRERKQKREAEQIKDKLEKLSLTSEVLVGEEDKIPRISPNCWHRRDSKSIKEISFLKIPLNRLVSTRFRLKLRKILSPM
jgi:hypothetical protein